MRRKVEEAPWEVADLTTVTEVSSPAVRVVTVVKSSDPVPMLSESTDLVE